MSIESEPKQTKPKSFFKTIPRTIRWRIQLGLLSLPSSVETAVAAANLTQSLSQSRDKTEGDESGDGDSGAIDDEFDQNKVHSDTKDEVQIVNTMEENSHKKKDTDEIVHNENANVSKKGRSSKKSSSNYSLKDVLTYNQQTIRQQHDRFDMLAQRHLWENSPLALIEKEEAEAKEKATKDAEVRGEGAALKKETVVKVQCKDGSDPLSAILMEEVSSSPEKQETTNDNSDKNKKGNSSWSEFYSSRETLNLIEKDLHRLSPSHHIVTPVSILYSSEISENKSSADAKDVNEKDDDDGFERISIPSKNETNTLEDRKKLRTQLLSQILFIYARHNPSLGYRQGMHEVLSFILIAFEVDFHNTYNRVSNETMNDDFNAQRILFQKEKICHDAFSIFETIMYYLAAAYDSASDTISRPPHLVKFKNRHTIPETLSEQYPSHSMERVAETVLQHVRVNGTEALFNHLTNEIHIPPQLYCARWVRLMFTREITSVHKSLFLWDKIFHSLHRKQSTLIPILEYICASMILRVQDRFLPQGEDDDANESINILMNYPPIDDVKGFWNGASDLMDGKLIKAKNEMYYHHNFLPQNSVGDKESINTTQDTSRPFLMGATNSIRNSSPQQIYEQQQEQQRFNGNLNGVLKRMSNIYSGTLNTITKEPHPHQEQYPLQSEESSENKFPHPLHPQYNEYNQDHGVQKTFQRVANTWNKAVDTIGGSIENLVSSRGNNGNGQNAPDQHSMSFSSPDFDRNNKSSIPPMSTFSSGFTNHELNASGNLSFDEQLKESVDVLTKYLQSLQNEVQGVTVPTMVWDAVSEIDAVRAQIFTDKKFAKNTNVGTHPLAETNDYHLSESKD